MNLVVGKYLPKLWKNDPEFVRLSFSAVLKILRMHFYMRHKLLRICRVKLMQMHWYMRS